MLLGRVSSSAALLFMAWVAPPPALPPPPPATASPTLAAPVAAPPDANRRTTGFIPGNSGPPPAASAPAPAAHAAPAAPTPLPAPPPPAPAPATTGPSSPNPGPNATPGATVDAGDASASAASAAEFVTQVRTLARVTACAPTGAEIPARFDAQVVDTHCKSLAALAEVWRKRWLTRARPFFDQVVPTEELPTRVVYPFGGGDLLTALVVFPKAQEITTLSLEPGGDPRALDKLEVSELGPMLVEVRKKVNHLFAIGHSKTTDMTQLSKSKLPANLTYALVALTLLEFEVLSVRAFRVDPSGALVYLTQAELDANEGTGRRSPFASMEVEYQPRGGGPRRTFRHIAVNLDDAHMTADPSVLRHLESKGPVAAMTKAASYLLWWKEFGKIRGYLLRNMVWMISDSTGIPTDLARAAGFEQIPFGRFDGPMLGNGIRATEGFKKLWGDKADPLSFRFGYPDSAGHDHLLITRRAPRK